LKLLETDLETVRYFFLGFSSAPSHVTDAASYMNINGMLQQFFLFTQRISPKASLILTVQLLA
jgi:hypothetical protein